MTSIDPSTPSTAPAGHASGTRSAVGRLRQATAGVHAALDALVPQPFASLPAYARFLLAMRNAHAGVEQALGAHTAALATLGYEAGMSRTLWLDADLAALGESASPAASAGTAAPVLDDLSAALGAVYVVEGSSLGGRVLLNDALSLSDVARRGATQFLEGFGDGTGTRWRTTVVLLERYGERHGAASIDGMVRGATRTFAHFHAVLDAALECGDVAARTRSGAVTE